MAAPILYANKGFQTQFTLTKPGSGLEELDAVLSEPKFQRWWGNIDHQAINVASVDIRDVNWFGPPMAKGKLGFLKVDCVATSTATGKPIPAIAFIRGGAVGVLVRITITDTNESFFLMTNQLRFPVGRYCVETPAGMVDAEHNFAGVAAKEIKEETGIIIGADDLVPLGRIYPSPGGCDEDIELFYYEGTMTRDEFEAKQRAVYGEGEHEHITLVFVPEETFSDALIEFGDVKGEVAYRRYLISKGTAKRRRPQKVQKVQKVQRVQKPQRKQPAERRPMARGPVAPKSAGSRCGYNPRTGRCGVRHEGMNPELCYMNEPTRRCRQINPYQ